MPFWAEGIPEGRVDIPTFLAGFSGTGGFPSSPNGKKPACQYKRCKRHGFDPWVGEVCWRRKWPPTPVFWPAESHGQRNLASYSPRGHEESDTTEHTHTHTQRQRDYEGIEMGPPCLCRSPGTPRPGQTRLRGCVGRNESFCL